MTSGRDAPRFVPDGFRILHKLGSGQTSHVYLARHASFGEVALKLPREELAKRPVLRRMFENEVQITLNLEHPNVVRAFAGYPTGEQAYLALEYCTGGTLDQLLLEQGGQPLEKALRLIADVAGGLAYSHRRRVLHRDVKPANVFLTSEGRAKLGDFGTGVFMTEKTEERVGTAFYMAPEIFEGGPASVSSDIYSLGVLAYEVLAGERPFVGDSYDALMLAHLTGVPRDLRHVRSDLPGKVTKAISAAMARDPAKRLPSVQAFLQAFSSGEAASPATAPGPSSDAATPQPTGRALRASRPSPDKGADIPTGRSSRTRQAPAADETPVPPGRKKPRRGGLFGWFRRKKP